MDLLAVELGMDPSTLRRRNLIRRASRTPPPSGRRTTSATTTRRSTARSSSPTSSRSAPSRRRAASAGTSGSRSASGWRVYVEVTGFARKEFASVEVDADGTRDRPRRDARRTGRGTRPRSRRSRRACSACRSSASASCTRTRPRSVAGEGTFGSRSLQIGGSSVFEAAEAVLEQARARRGAPARVSVDDVVVSRDGRRGRRGAERSRSRGRSWRDRGDPSSEPEGWRRGSPRRPTFQRDYTYPFGAHVAVVEVDTETGDVRLLRHVAVDDCGTDPQPDARRGPGARRPRRRASRRRCTRRSSTTSSGRRSPRTSRPTRCPPRAELPVVRARRDGDADAVEPAGRQGIGESATVGSTPAV